MGTPCRQLGDGVGIEDESERAGAPLRKPLAGSHLTTAGFSAAAPSSAHTGAPSLSLSAAAAAATAGAAAEAAAGGADDVLTDLQKLIIQAIAFHRGSATTDDVDRYVSQFWSKLKKRDGSSYQYDCRRVVLATLANASPLRPLFMREEEHASVGGESQRWKFGPRVTEDLVVKLDGELPFLEVSHKLSGAGVVRRGRGRPKRSRAPSPSAAAAAAAAAAATAGVAADAGAAGDAAPRVTLAQLGPERLALATYLHECAEHTAHIGDLIERAAFPGGTSRTDARRLIEGVLEAAPAFATRTVGDKWKLCSELISELGGGGGGDDVSGDESASTGKRLRVGGDGDEDAVQPSSGSGASTSAFGAVFGEGDISVMQETLMAIMLEHSGSAHLDTITDVAAQRIPSMRRKNMDLKRSIVASLSHNPPGFFRKHPGRPGFWTITARGRLLADAMMASSSDRLLFSVADVPQ